MAAKLLHSLADENPDLQKQIGCMTGILQLFDRQHVLSGRHMRHKRLPPGTSHLNIGNAGKEYNVFQREATDMSLNESFNEKQRFNKELSRASFSSCSSSLSSSEYNKTAPSQASSFDQILLSRTPSRDSIANQSNTSPRVGRQQLDLRDVVKDSMYREARTLSVKTSTNEEPPSRSMKHRDSPRPVQLPQSTDGALKVNTNWKQKMPVDLKESLLVLAKLRDAPWNYNEVVEHDRPSQEVKDGYLQSFSRDAPRFSYDGREVDRLSFESRDTIRSAPKFKDFPRLSLDSRESSIQGSKSVSNTTRHLKNLHVSDCSSEKSSDPPRSSGSRKHPPSVVAKLMGLEALPGSPLASDTQVKGDPFVSSLDGASFIRPIRTDSPRNTLKGPTSPRWKNPDLVMKPMPNSKFPMEVAPWRQPDGTRAFDKSALKHSKGLAGSSNPFPSVYSEIEKRLEDLEFKQSGKDLRALKQILDAMQSKGLLDTRKEEEPSNNATQRDNEPKQESASVNSRLTSEQSRKKNQKAATTSRADSSRCGESPIVIMKPAKLVEKSGIPALSVIQIDGLPGLPKLQKAPNGKKNPSSSRAVKDTSPENSHRDSGANPTKKKDNARNVRQTHTSSKPQHLPKENTVSSIKTTGSVSPRLQQKKAEQDKRSRPPTPPSDTNKTRWKSNRQGTDSGSSVRKPRVKPSHVSQMDDQLSEISNESRTLSNQGDDISQMSDSNLSLDSKTDIEVTSNELPAEISGSHCLQMKTSKYSDSRSLENAELATPAPEHPSPVSILDASIYRDDEPSPSPVKQISKALKGNRTLGSEWSATDNSVEPGLSTEINRKKLQNIDNLVQKLRRLNSHYDEAKTDYIASLCENTDPDNRYISEILLASGLLLRDLGSGLATFQLHPSGHPINPELFFVLEQTKTSSLLRKDDCSSLKLTDSKLNQEKSHRKLVFDAVNEILARELSVVAASPEPWTTSKKLATKTLSAQKLLKELCSEIEQLQTKKPDEDDSLDSVLKEDMMQRSESWTDFYGDISNVVLDIERLIFKDLVDEIVYVEAAHLRAKSGRRRQLFN
ncbi:protein LONGIFOLIA 1-like [Benincasa hispida]|uniref:protein LONGIFOLIA 1-like n=1 Tax=Benincasa hispida TaxID=102211 RepID=UPI0018FFFA5C|nr:protein LONGIFOLIA 1-like [Benincasa hispida]